MAGEVIVDALPYIDQGYDEAGVREAALAMVEEETRRYRPTKNYLEHLPPLNISQFETEMMKSEWERMQQRQPMDVLSMKRYELPPPPAGKMTDIAAWTECVENSQAQLEHQATRICNLELMLEYGCEAWKTYLELLVASVTQAQKGLQALRKDIQEINWERKNAQMKGGERLRELEATWVSLVSKNYDIEQACVTLEEEIVYLQREREYGAKRRRLHDERVAAKRRKIELQEQKERELEHQRLEQQRIVDERQRQRELAETEAVNIWQQEQERVTPIEPDVSEVKRETESGTDSTHTIDQETSCEETKTESKDGSGGDEETKYTNGDATQNGSPSRNEAVKHEHEVDN